MNHFFYLFLSSILLWGISCTNNKHEILRPQVENHRIKIDYATCFNIIEELGIKKLTIKNPFEDFSTQQTFVLLQKGQNYKAKENETVIEVPIQKIIPFSTSYLSMIDTLGELKSISAVETSKYIYNPNILQKIKDGEIKEIGSFRDLNIEKIILQSPDLIMSVGNAGEPSKQVQKLNKIGIPNLNNYDWKETHPLGKAEWIKVFGLLYNKEKEANAIFKFIEGNYNQLKNTAPKTETNVLFATMYSGTWYIPGGESYVAKLVKDANGTYPWAKDSSTGSLPLSFETVANKQTEPSIWLNTNFKTISELIASDNRYEPFVEAVKEKIYNNNKRTTTFGGNDYFEKGTLRADLILKDYIYLFSSKVVNEDSLYFFTKIKP